MNTHEIKQKAQIHPSVGKMCTTHKLGIAKDASYPPPTSGKMSIYSDGMDRMMSESPAPKSTNIYEVRWGIQISDTVIFTLRDCPCVTHHFRWTSVRAGSPVALFYYRQSTCQSLYLALLLLYPDLIFNRCNEFFCNGFQQYHLLDSHHSHSKTFSPTRIRHCHRLFNHISAFLPPTYTFCPNTHYQPANLHPRLRRCSN